MYEQNLADYPTTALLRKSLTFNALSLLLFLSLPSV